MPLLYAILVAVFLILLIVSLVFAAKHWHPLHITAVVLVFLTAVPAVYCIGFVMKTRVNLVSFAKKQTAEAEKQKSQYDDILYGQEPGPGGGYGTDSRNAVLVKLKRLNLGKGRTWENATINAVANDQISFAVPAATAAEGEAAAADAPAEDLSGTLPSVDSLVYVFQNVTMNGNGPQPLNIPGNYLGVFRVDSVNGQQVNTTGQLVLAELGNGMPVQIYEKPPTDFHGSVYRALDLEFENTDIDTVRAKFEEVFPAESLGMEAGSPGYVQLVDEVSFDRRPITSINTWLSAKGRGSWEPSPQDVMVKAQVLEDLVEPVNGTQDMLVTGEFDSLGRTNIPALKLANDNATVKKSKQGDDTDFWLVDAVTATYGYTQADGTVVPSLEEQGKIEVIESLYYRPLRDYTTEIAQKLLDVQRMETRVSEYERYIAQSNLVREKTTAQVTLRDDKISQLTTDQENLKRDLAVIDDYSAEMESKLSQLKQQMKETYLQISYIHQQLQKNNAALVPAAN